MEHLDNGWLSMNFPSRRPIAYKKPEVLGGALDTNLVAISASRDLLLILENEEFDQFMTLLDEPFTPAERTY